MQSELPSNPTEKLHGLDTLRALAITLVFFFHYRIPIFEQPEWVSDYAKFGWTGVDLFFVLSGFLISSQLFHSIKRAENISYKQFFIKRVFRIIPLYLVVVFIYFCFPFFHEREALPPLWTFLTFTQNFGLDLRLNGTFSHAWSLCVEEHFYFLLPLSILFFQSTKLLKKALVLLPAIFILGFVLRHYAWVHLYFPSLGTESAGVFWYKYIYYPTYNRLDGLLVGVAIAAIYQFVPKIWNKILKLNNLWFITSIATLTLAYFICEDEHSYNASIFGFPLIAIGYGVMVISALCPTSFLYRWNSRIMTFIASLSYAIYLSHKGLIHVTQSLFANDFIDRSSNLMLLLCIVGSVLGALLLNRIVERPFMQLRKKIL
jgi:peptidoglycan/LPS O-acetylase OafA/YrhL